jgi:microsomal epoxide hydrolase
MILQMLIFIHSRIGEKFQAWTDQELVLRDILDSVTLYWFTDTISRCFYTYRDALECPYHGIPQYFIHKPLGFSFFPYEIMPAPRSWVETTGNLVWSRVHEQGGHFAALEMPTAFLRDVEEFAAEVWS